MKQEEAEQEVYEIKRIEFLGRQRVPILMQGLFVFTYVVLLGTNTVLAKNGPCPLLAIANALLLSNRISLNDNQELISLTNLVELLAGSLFDLNNNNKEEDANKHQLLHDCIELLPKLSRGMDVNVQFSSVSSFEFDRNVAVFDMFGLQLYHGWVVAVDDDMYAMLHSMSYNTAATEADKNAVISHFLQSTSSQLTYAGFAELYAKTRDREISVFFRNNHFSTMFKFESHLYLLCTDHAFLTRPGVVWERLSDINGDTELCSPVFGDINAYLPLEEVQPERLDPVRYEELASFYAIYCPERNDPATINAVLENNFTREKLNGLLREKYGQDLTSELVGGGGGIEDADAVLARQLQLEEDNLTRRAQQQQRPASTQPAKQASCAIC